MTLRHFQIFVTVCDQMNMTAAARSLYMSQPAVSQAVAELEDHYQVRLFERLSRRLYLTRAGEKLLGYARHIIRLNKDAETSMLSLNHNGTVRVGTSVTIGSCILPKLAADFTAKFPQTSIEVEEDNTAKIEQLLLQDKLDLGLVEGEIVSGDLFCRSFAEDSLVLICGRGHPFYQRNEVDPIELEQENFILRETGSGTRKTFEAAMAERGIRWKAGWTCNNTDTIKSAVAEGLGISVISERAVKEETRTGLLHSISIAGMGFSRQFKLVYHKNKYLTAAIQQFSNFCFQKYYKSNKK